MKIFCRTCLRKIEDEHFTSLKEDAVSVQIKLELGVCVPELVLARVQNPVLCMLCVSALHMAYNFKAQCMTTEKRILSYICSLAPQHTPQCTQAIKMEVLAVEPQTEAAAAVRPLPPLPKQTDVLDDLNNLLDDVLCVQDLQDNSVSSGESQTDLVKNNLNSSEPRPLFMTDQVPVEISLATIQDVEPLAASLGTECDDDVFEENESSDSESIEEDIPQNLELRECSVKLRRLPDTFVYFIESPFNRLVKPWRVAVDQVQPKPPEPEGDANRVNVQLFRCNESKCNYNTIYKFAISKHKASKHGTCFHCEFHTDSPKLLKEHMDSHRPNKKIKKGLKCTNSDSKAGSMKALEQHLKVHTREKRFACNSCSFCTALKGHLTSHSKKHSIHHQNKS